MSRLLFTVSFTLLTTLPSITHADRYDDLIAKWADHGITGYDGTVAMTLAWSTVPRLQALYYGYMVTGDVSLIDKAAIAVNHWVNVLPKADPNGDLEYDGSPGEAGRIIGAITMFIYLVKTNDDLSAHLTAANAHLAWLEANAIKTWLEKYYINDDKETPGYYHYPGSGAPIYKCYDGDCPDDGSPSMENMTAQHNKNSDFGMTILWLYLATGKAQYKTVVEEIALNFKSKLFWSEWGRFYSWYYWDPSWGGDFASGENGIGQVKNSDRRWIEHRSGYGSLSMEFVTECYRNGIVFCKTDIDRFVVTNRDIMWDGITTELSHGTWLANDGSVPIDYGGLYGPLCAYDETNQLADLAYASHDANYSGWGGLGLPYYVHIMKLSEAEKHPADIGWIGPLEAVKVEALDKISVKITFYNEVDPVSAGNLSNYKMSRGTELLAVSVSGDRMSVTLTTAEQIPDYSYKMTCYDVYDIYGNKTFAYGNSQPWYFTGSGAPAGIQTSGIPAKTIQTITVQPSPFRDRAVFTFSGLPVDDINHLTISTLDGREINRLDIASGRADWDGTDSAGNRVGSGIYWYLIGETGPRSTIIKID